MAAIDYRSCSVHKAGNLSLALGALGVVYGDIGISPLYAIKECFHGLHTIELSDSNIMGVFSLVFWSLTMVVTIKYVFFILKANNQGEGGIFVLLSRNVQTPAIYFNLPPERVIEL